MTVPTHVYRSMRAERDGWPACGSTARTLGVRSSGVDADVTLDAAGQVIAGTGGMSVAPDDPRRLPPHRRPPELDGTGRDPVFGVSRGRLPAELEVHADTLTHALVRPRRAMDLADFARCLCASRTAWRRIAA